MSPLMNMVILAALTAVGSAVGCALVLLVAARQEKRRGGK